MVVGAAVVGGAVRRARSGGRGLRGSRRGRWGRRGRTRRWRRWGRGGWRGRGGRDVVVVVGGSVGSVGPAEAATAPPTTRVTTANSSAIAAGPRRERLIRSSSASGVGELGSCTCPFRSRLGHLGADRRSLLPLTAGAPDTSTWCARRSCDAAARCRHGGTRPLVAGCPAGHRCGSHLAHRARRASARCASPAVGARPPRASRRDGPGRVRPARGSRRSAGCRARPRRALVHQPGLQRCPTTGEDPSAGAPSSAPRHRARGPLRRDRARRRRDDGGRAGASSGRRSKWTTNRSQAGSRRLLPYSRVSTPSTPSTSSTPVMPKRRPRVRPSSRSSRSSLPIRRSRDERPAHEGLDHLGPGETSLQEPGVIGVDGDDGQPEHARGQATVDLDLEQLRHVVASGVVQEAGDALGVVQGLGEVGDEVTRVLEADRDPHRAGADAVGRQLVGRQVRRGWSTPDGSPASRGRRARWPAARCAVPRRRRSRPRGPPARSKVTSPPSAGAGAGPARAGGATSSPGQRTSATDGCCLEERRQLGRAGALLARTGPRGCAGPAGRSWRRTARRWPPGARRSTRASR